MVRRRKFSKNRGRSRVPRNTLSGVDRVERVPGKHLVQLSSSTNPIVIPLVLDSLGPRLTALGNVFQEHRFSEIRVVLHPGFTVGGQTRTSYAVGYFKVIPATPPTTLVNLYNGASSRYHDIGDTVPVTLVLSRSVLLNTTRPWFVNNAASGTEASDYTQGVIYIVNGGTLVNGLNANLEITYMCEFRGPTTPAVD